MSTSSASNPPDETGVAVVKDGRRVLPMKLHPRSTFTVFGGVVPEIASASTPASFQLTRQALDAAPRRWKR